MKVQKTNNQEAKIFRLMVKTHRLTGYRYLCVTSRSDFDLYLGSGLRWLDHLKEFGAEIDTELLMATEDPHLLSVAGALYSELFDVVASDDWANLIPEVGYDDYMLQSFFWSELPEKDKATIVGRRNEALVIQQPSLSQSMA